MKTINEWSKEVHANAKSHGWWWENFVPLSPAEKLSKHMLIVSEVAEATEEVRNAVDSLYFGPGGKPEGEAVELADAVIRIMDYFEFNGWDLEKVIELKHNYNRTRPYRHGGKSA